MSYPKHLVYEPRLPQGSRYEVKCQSRAVPAITIQRYDAYIQRLNGCPSRSRGNSANTGWNASAGSVDGDIGHGTYTSLRFYLSITCMEYPGPLLHSPIQVYIHSWNDGLGLEPTGRSQYARLCAPALAVRPFHALPQQLIRIAVQARQPHGTRSNIPRASPTRIATAYPPGTTPPADEATRRQSDSTVNNSRGSPSLARTP